MQSIQYLQDLYSSCLYIICSCWSPVLSVCQSVVVEVSTCSSVVLKLGIFSVCTLESNSQYLSGYCLLLNLFDLNQFELERCMSFKLLQSNMQNSYYVTCFEQEFRTRITNTHVSRDGFFVFNCRSLILSSFSYI